MTHRKDIQIGHETLTIETGRLAKQADGSCTIRYGDTLVLTTACAARSSTPRGFLPLTVDYREYTSAAGRIPGGFFKREGRPSEKEIITCRLTDRPLRPLFPKGYFSETQVISSVLSADRENDPDILAINGASAALILSEIPFYHAIGAVRVGMVDGEMLFNPPNSERDVSDLDLVVVGSEEAVVMVEAAANQLSESEILDCIFAAHEQIQKIIRAQHELFRELNLEKPDWQPQGLPSPELFNQVRSSLIGDLSQALNTPAKFERRDAVKAVVDRYLEQAAGDDEEKRSEIKQIVNDLEDHCLREQVLQQGRRFDGRRLDEVRALETETGLLPRVHGSALFQRGETQALASVTLGTRRDAQIIEEYEGETHQKFMLHYNFPPYSVGEVRFMRGSSRREIGHGVLARRALMPVLPAEEDFPYTVRVVSEILESNGSSSMATVCASSLALFDAGVPLLAPVAGVAMGLVKNGDEFGVLTDIAGQEDHHGDMDFKVAGTSGGITALQMDIKIKGVTKEIMQQALEQARAGRLHILEHMASTLEAPRDDISAHAPRIHTISVSRDKIRDVIGPGGKTVRAITEETGCHVDIDDEGRITIASPDGTAAERAIEMIERLTEVPEVGKVYTGQVRRVEAYGAFVQVLPGTDGLLHISEIAPQRINEVSDVLKEGDEVDVKVIEIDGTGRIRLSRKQVLIDRGEVSEEELAAIAKDRESRPERSSHGDRGGDSRRGEGPRRPRSGGRPPRRRS